MPSELKGIIGTTVLIILTFVFPRARVLTVPLVFVLILIALFWSARRSAERGARQPDAYAKPVEGAVVLPRPSGDARLLRPLARRRGVAHLHHRRPHGDPVPRHQPQGERLLLLEGPEVGDHHLHRRLPHP